MKKSSDSDPLSTGLSTLSKMLILYPHPKLGGWWIEYWPVMEKVAILSLPSKYADLEPEAHW